MDKERKKEIDDLWMNTDYGKYVLLAASEKYDEANKILEKITNEWPFSYDEVEKEISRKIADELKNEAEFDDYMRLLDDENYDLVEFMISHDTLGYVYDFLKGK